MIYIYIFISGFIIAITFRYFLVHLNKGVFRQGLFGDSSIHWTIIKNTKRDPDFKFIQQYLIGDEPTSYPRAFHRYAALFPLNYVKAYPWLPNLVLFSVFAGLLASYSYYFATIVGLDPYSVSIVSYLLFVLAVSNTTFDGPAIAYLKLSARLYARLFTSAYFASLVIGMAYWDIPSLILSCVLGSIAGTASTFGRQAMWFTSPLLALVAWSWVPIGVFLITLFGSYVLSDRLFVKGVEYTVKLWVTYNSHTKNSQVVKSALSKFINLGVIFSKTLGVKGTIIHLLKKEPTRLFVRYPELIMVLAYLLLLGQPEWIRTAPNNWSFEPLIISTLIIYVLTSTKWLNHLGESYRYIEYNLTLAMPILLGSFLVTFSGDFVFILIFSIFIIFGVLLNKIFQRRKYEHDDLQLFINELGLDEEDVVFPVSMRLGADICARVDCKSFWWQPGNVTQEIFEHFIEEYPFLKKDWKPLAREFDVTHVVVEKAALDLVDWSYDFDDLNKILESEKYAAYRVDTQV